MKKKCLWSIMLLFCAILYSCNQEEIVENELPDFPQPTKSRVELRTGKLVSASLLKQRTLFR